jgi:hypothetical protein
LDKRKYAGTRREKERAQKVLKAIRALGRIDKPVLVRDGVWLMGLVAEPDDAFFVEHRLQRQDQDDRLLASALAFKAGAEASARVVICTADTGLTLKGPTRQMEILELDDSLKLPDEPDETERELEASRRELAAIRTAAPDVRVRFADGPVLEACIQLVGPMDSGAIQRHVGRFRAAHPHVHPTPETIPMPNGGVFKLPSFAGVPGFVTPEEAHAHNKAIDNILRTTAGMAKRLSDLLGQETFLVSPPSRLAIDGGAQVDAGAKVALNVEDEGRIVGTQEVTLPPDGESATVPISFTAADAVSRIEQEALRTRRALSESGEPGSP